MRVLADTRLYPPRTYAGAELALHNLLRHLDSQGHSCEVVVREGGLSDTTIDGIRVYTVSHDDGAIDQLYKRADLIISHLEASLYAQRLALQHSKPLVHLVHNATQLTWHGHLHAGLVVFNSESLASQCRLQHVGTPAAILNPPVYPSNVLVDTDLDEPEHRRILQINLSPLKGGFHFWRLAQREVDRAFLAVIGGYDEQINRGGDNVTVLPAVPHHEMHTIYRMADVLLVPSEYETWGRVAVEAMANGLPIIAHPSVGLREAIGTGGVEWADREDPAAWSRALSLLDEPEAYHLHADKSRERFSRLQEVQAEQLSDLTRQLENL